MTPLSFTDPVIEQETYTAAMCATLVNHRGPVLTIDDAVNICRVAGFERWAIARYIPTAFKAAEQFQRKHVDSGTAAD